MELFSLVFLAVGLTYGLYSTRQSVLGFCCTGAWAILGVYAYNQSTATWDWQYALFFFSMMGMTIVTAYSSFILRRQIKSELEEVEEEWDKGESEESDEEEEEEKLKSKSTRLRRLRGRAKKRRGRETIKRMLS